MVGVGLAVVALDWASKSAAAALLGDLVITNDKEPLLWAVPAALSACAALAWLASSPLVALACGLLFGGWLANNADRALFGPVVDFLPLPLGYVGNLADLALLGAGLILGPWLARGLFLRLRGRPFALAG